MSSAPPVDPNRPTGLEIAPSTSHSILLTAGASDAGDDASQDIEGFGIAGRTWEAAYAMRVYLSPPPATLEFSPPCPLFASTSSHPPTPSTLLEIGSGTGYLSLALAPHLPASTTLILTDLPEVCPLLTRNLTGAQKRWESSHSSASLPTLRVEPLPWGDEEVLRNLSLFREKAGSSTTTTILASDLVYFPFLYPALLWTLLGLTIPRREGGESPTVVFGYKIRSLVREQPFWSAFGRWFEMTPVLTRPIPIVSSTSDPAPPPGNWSCFGEADDLYIFICTRRPSTYHLPIPENDEHLLRGEPGGAGPAADDQFEMMLLSALSFD